MAFDASTGPTTLSVQPMQLHPSLRLRKISPAQLGYQAILFFSYLISAQVVHFLFPSQISPALIWPPAGIALAGIALGGYTLWPAIFLASIVNSLLNANSPPLLALIVAAGNALQALFGVWLLRKLAFETLFDRVRDAFAMALVAFVASTVVPTFRVIGLFLTGTVPATGYSEAWSSWWTGEILSIIVLSPVLIRWISRPRFRRTPLEWFEIAVAFGLLFICDLILFWTPYSEFHSIPVVYIILAPLTWIALRIGPRGITFALLLNSILALAGIASGYSSLTSSDATTGGRLFQGEVFIIIITLIYLALCAIVEERKQTSKALQEHVGRLEDVVAKISKEDEAKSRFIATLAHELRNPLAPLLSSLELMHLTSPTEDEAKTLVAQMTQNVKTMRHLLDDLLDISRISRNKLTLQKEHVDLHSIVNNSLRTVTSTITDRGHSLSTSLPAEAVLLEADPVRLEQIIVNLLNNSAKYTEPGGRIVLSIDVHGDTVTIRVKDNGIGIPSEMMDRIFEPFLQIENDSRKVSGLGIGLSLTKNLVEMHGGSIKAMSDGAGYGSEFIVELPFTNLATDSLKPVVEEPQEIGAMKILVVDDNRPAADGLKKLLSLKGHDVQSVYDGTSALGTVKKWTPEVILLDIGLPDMQGYEVASRMRELGVQSVIVALTGYGQDSDRRRAEASGFNHHLTKPVALSELEEVLREVPR
jgi:signal transduction histidine kinase/CheY-like chemotaxis protein